MNDIIEKNYQKIAKNNIILKAIVGSKLYGTDTPDSDIDYTGVFMPSKEMLYGLYPCKQISFDTNSKSSGAKNTSEDTDEKYYTLARFFDLSIKNNPNIMELFFVPDDKMEKCNHKVWDEVRNNYDLFISKKIFDSFFGYAIAQEHLMKTKTDRYNSIIEAEKYLREIYNYGIEEMDEDIVSELKKITKNYRNTKNQEREYHAGLTVEQVYKQIKEEMNRYGHRRYNIIKHGYEIKFASHLIRLLLEGIELVETGKLELPLKKAYLIKDIKTGVKTLDDVLEISIELKDKFRQLEKKSKLREKPNTKKINELLIRLTDDYIH